MYDQIGGGFARYSVDARWVIPHFEKMLYDNALLARAYLHGYQVSGEELFLRVCTETLDWALRDLRQEEGGFASSLDADSEGEEGRFYVWTPDEMRAVAGDAAVAYFGLDGPPNFEGTWAPVRAGRDPEDLAAIKPALREARERRVWPGLDDKRLTAWNALMISALADAGGALERPDYVDAAVACAEFVWRDLRDDRGRLLRTYNRGRAQLGAYLEDHAFLLEALLTLYAATFDPRWFAAARELAEAILERFADAEHGGFFATADDHEALVARRKELEDTPIPSGASSAALRPAAAGRADRRAPLRGGRGGRAPAPARRRAAVPERVRARAPGARLPPLAGEGGRDRRPGRRAARARGPRCVPPPRGAGGRPGGDVPLLEGRDPVDGRAAAYVCERFTCLRPVTAPDDLAHLL